MIRNAIWPRVMGAIKREGLLGIPRLGAIKLLENVARQANGLAKQLEQLGKVYSREDIALLSRNAMFHNLHRGQRCFVIGNGPSLESQDLSPLRNELTFVMNAFWKHPVLNQWQPTYYFLADPLYFDGSEPMHQFLIDLRANVYSTDLFVPLSARQSIKVLAPLTLERIYFFGFRGNLKDGLQNWPDFTLPVPGVQSVSQMAIMAAMYMGCSPIYLLGLDHDWLAQRGMDRHFYDGKTVDNHPIAHGDLGRVSYKADLADALKLWDGYEHIQTCAVSHGVRIVNATRGGFLDVFERADYETVIRCDLIDTCVQSNEVHQ